MSQMVIGNEYTNEEIYHEYRGQTQGGIRLANATNSIILIENPNAVYHDRIDEINPTVLLYTGQGLVGDQYLTNRNRALLNSVEDKKELHLFYYKGPNRYEYRGEYQLVDKVFEETQPDENEDDRRVYMFPIRRV